MATTRYRIDPARSKVEVMARSSIHDTKTVWPRVSGNIEVDPENPAGGATARIEVDMREFDAGDFLKNRKIKKDLAVDAHPTARFELTELSNVQRRGADADARAIGEIHWHGRSAEVVATGTATLSADRVSARARFELDVTRLGVKPPRILMLKVEEVVSVTVTLEAKRD